MDNPHRYPEYLIQLTCKKISSSREVGNCFRRSFLPNTFTISQRCGSHLTSHHEHTDFRIFRSDYSIQRTNHRVAITPAYTHIHIRLPRTKPYFTNQYIINSYRFTITYLYAIRTTIYRCFHLHFPLP